MTTHYEIHYIDDNHRAHAETFGNEPERAARRFRVLAQVKPAVTLARITDGVVVEIDSTSPGGPVSSNR